MSTTLENDIIQYISDQKKYPCYGRNHYDGDRQSLKHIINQHLRRLKDNKHLELRERAIRRTSSISSILQHGCMDKKTNTELKTLVTEMRRVKI